MAMASSDVDGFLIPRTDEYQGEYIPACADRLRWISGFTGSAGMCVVLKECACVLSDGRYTIQLKQQVDGALFETADITKISAPTWILSKGPAMKIGYDPKLHTPKDVEAYRAKGLDMVAVTGNLVDAVWQDRPAPPASAIQPFPLKYAGTQAKEKIDTMAQALRDQGADACVLTLSDSIAWLLNVRGNDLPHIPVALSYAIVLSDGRVDWFVDEQRVGSDVQNTFGDAVRLCAPDTLEATLQSLADKKVMLDPVRTSQWFFERLEQAGAKILVSKDPTIAPKAIKAPSEQAAMRAAHERDGVAVTKFLYWLSGQVTPDSLRQSGLTELSVEAALAQERQKFEHYRDSSFDTIAGFNANGAIVHYRATEKTNQAIAKDGLLLVDSGGQYEDGTTDITRTVSVGAPSPRMREDYTRVLKGHVAISKARFPYGTTGAQIDVLARTPLWLSDMDYAHGTGHGVGCYLSVHEEAVSFSSRGTAPVEPGMIISNEPGYYREGQYGIRIENLVLCQEFGRCADTGKAMLGFETLTLAPYDRSLIVPDILSRDDIEWINAYHGRVYDTLAPSLNDEERAWLKYQCTPL